MLLNQQINHKKKPNGFSLFELMIAMAIIAILTAIAIPAYQKYIQRAALTDILQVSTPFRTATEICFIERGKLDECESGKQSIPLSQQSNYVELIQVKKGVISV